MKFIDLSAGVRPLSVSAETRKEIAKYSLSAYENADPTNRVKALLFVPKPAGMNALPMDADIRMTSLSGRTSIRCEISSSVSVTQVFLSPNSATLVVSLTLILIFSLS